MRNKTMTTVVGAAIATSMAGIAGAAENPFVLKDLSSGYAQVAEAGAPAAEPAKEKKEMVCGEGKCGGAMMKSPEMNCGAMMKDAKEKEAQQGKAMEGKCAGMKMDGAAPAAPGAPVPAPAPSTTPK